MRARTDLHEIAELDDAPAHFLHVGLDEDELRLIDHEEPPVFSGEILRGERNEIRLETGVLLFHVDRARDQVAVILNGRKTSVSWESRNAGTYVDRADRLL